MNIGLLGFGSMGRTHAYSISNIPYFYTDLGFNAHITGVCTSHPDTAAAAAVICGCTRSVTDEDELIYDPTIDIIDICTPNIYHYETLKKAVGAGKHVYCEKPLCTTAAQSAEIAELARNSGIKAQIVFNNRFLAPLMRAKQLISDGALGNIISFNCAYRHASAADPAKPAGWKQCRDVCGGGTLVDLGSHQIDLIRWLCGEITSVTGKSQIAYPVRLGSDGTEWHTDADEAFYFIAELSCGAVGTIESNKLTVGTNDDLTLEIYGEKGAIKFSLMEPNWLYFYDGTRMSGELGGDRGFTRIECVGRYPKPGGIFPGVKAPAGWLRGHIGSYFAFLSSIKNNTPCSPSFDDGAAVAKIIEAAYSSCR